MSSACRGPRSSTFDEPTLVEHCRTMIDLFRKFNNSIGLVFTMDLKTLKTTDLKK
jgi:hypothetical protein